MSQVMIRYFCGWNPDLFENCTDQEKYITADENPENNCGLSFGDRYIKGRNHRPHRHFQDVTEDFLVIQGPAVDSSSICSATCDFRQNWFQELHYHDQLYCIHTFWLHFIKGFKTKYQSIKMLPTMTKYDQTQIVWTLSYCCQQLSNVHVHWFCRNSCVNNLSASAWCSYYGP